MPVFHPTVVHECAMECLGYPKPEMFDVFGKAMEKRYPGLMDFSQPWIYSIAGGAMIQMKLYYASLTEYIMIWGTPIGSEGHSGRHFTGFWDTVIDGEMWYYGEGEFEKKIYTPGSRVYVGPGQASDEFYQRRMGRGIRQRFSALLRALWHRFRIFYLF